MTAREMARVSEYAVMEAIPFGAAQRHRADPGEGVKILVMAARTTASGFNDRQNSSSTL